MLDLLGAQCVACYLVDRDVLEIDHIEPVAKSGQPRGHAMILSAIRKGKMMTSDLQVLCANCHRRKTRADMDTLEDRPQYDPVIARYV